MLYNYLINFGGITMLNTAIKLNLSLLNSESILTKVYLADHDKNMQIFAALQQGSEAINKFLPNHFAKLNKSCRAVGGILASPEIKTFTLESEIRSGFPFLMLENFPVQGVRIINRMNYADEHLSPIEASMVLNALAYTLLCEESTDEDEQYFAAFMVDYIKILASKNRSNKKFNSSAFSRVID